MSLLSIVQQVASKVLGTLPSTYQGSGVVSSGDQAIQTIINLVNEEGQETSNKYTWQALRNEATFTTGGNQGGILAFGTLTPGAGYNGGLSSIFNNVALTGGHGTGATASINVSSGVVASCNIFPPTLGSGANYQVGDVLSAGASSLGGTGAGFSIVVKTVGLVGLENQGSILTIAGPDFNFIVDETLWDRTTRRPVFGPKTPQEWQQLKAQLMQGPWYQYTIRGNNFLMIPPPAQGDTIYFEWITKNWCTNAAGTVGQIAMVADTDVSRIDETVIVLGTIWRFRKGKGLAWQVDHDKWDEKIKELTTRDGAKARINLAGVQSDIYPGIIVPSGNWPIAGEPSGR